MEEFNSADILKNQDRKKKFAFLEVGLFEISFVLIIIILFFGILNYFNILSLSKLYPNTFGFLPHQTTLSTTYKPASTKPVQTNDVSAISDIPNYKLTLVNKNALMPYLGNFGLWNKTFNQNGTATKINRIVFHLTNQELTTKTKLIRDKNNNPTFSYKLTFSGKTLNIYISLPLETISAANQSKIYDYSVITEVYDLGPGSSFSQKEEQSKLIDVFNQVDQKNNQHFFEITSVKTP